VPVRSLIGEEREREICYEKEVEVEKGTNPTGTRRFKNARRLQSNLNPK